MDMNAVRIACSLIDGSNGPLPAVEQTATRRATDLWCAPPASGHTWLGTYV
jgi:hypothetical protein